MILTEEETQEFSASLISLKKLLGRFNSQEKGALFSTLTKHIVYREEKLQADKQFDFRLYRDRFEEVKDMNTFYERAYEFAEGMYIIEEYDEENCVFCKVLTKSDKNVLRLLLGLGFSVRITLDRWEKAVKHLYNQTNDTGYATVKAFACL